MAGAIRGATRGGPAERGGGERPPGAGRGRGSRVGAHGRTYLLLARRPSRGVGGSGPRGSGGAGGRARVRVTLNGILLTGGRSRRLGRDKAALPLGSGGSALAVHLGSLLSRIADHSVEVGPGVSGLPLPSEQDPGEGPLLAITLGARHFRRSGSGSSALVLATDLPLLSEGLLRAIATFPAPPGVSVVPLREGRPQPLCARWSPAALALAEERSAEGERRVQAALESGCRFLGEAELPGFDLERELVDVDDAGALRGLGLELPELPDPAEPPEAPGAPGALDLGSPDHNP